MASMSHEMRTPLNGVLGMLQLAMELELPPQAVKYYELHSNSAATATASTSLSTTSTASTTTSTTPSASAAAAVEAELLRATHEVLLESGALSLNHQFSESSPFQLTHPDLTSSLLTICGAPPVGEPSRSYLLAALGKAAARQQLDSTEWPNIAQRLTQRQLCSAQCAALLYKYVVLPQWRPETLPKLLTLLKHKAPPAERPSALAAVAAIERCVEYARAFGVPTKLISIEPMVCLPKQEYPSGVHMQLVLPGHGVLARAGRWDQLSKDSGLGERVCGGLSIFVNRLLGAVEAPHTPDPSSGHGSWRGGGGALPPGAPEVLVCSVGPRMESERLRVVSELWQAGVRADASHGEEPDLTSQMAQAELSGAPNVLILRRSLSEDGSGQEVTTARLKLLRSHREDELDVPTGGAELVSLLQAKRGGGGGGGGEKRGGYGGTPGARHHKAAAAE